MWNKTNSDEILSLFKGRTDRLGIMTLSGPKSVEVDDTSIKKYINQHLNGTLRIGIYNLCPGDVVHFAVIDVDAHGTGDQEVLKRNEEYSGQLQAALTESGISCQREISKSGPGNYHIWVFFNEPLEARYVRKGLSRFIQEQTKKGVLANRTMPEIFPKQDSGGIGNYVWLPFFPPDVKIRRTIFLDSNGEFVTPEFTKNPGAVLQPFADDLGQVSGDELVTPQGSTNPTPLEILKRTDIPEGERHNSMIILAGHYIGKRLSKEETSLLLKKWNGAQKNPLPEGEVENSVDSFYRKQEDSPADPPPIDVTQFSPLSVSVLLDILGLTIKRDDTNKLLTYMVELTAYTEDAQLNLSFNAPSSTGKSFIPMKIAELYPQRDVICVGYCSPTAFFHDHGIFDKAKGGYTLDLSRKILIFLDQPHTLLLQHLRPLLSHDQKEIQVKITDKSQRAGLRTKNVFLIGYPVVIFCTATLKLDEQEATRFILLSPEVSQEKIRLGINEKIRKSSDPLAYQRWVNADPRRQSLQLRIQAIRQEQIDYVNIPNKEEVMKRFYNGRQTLAPRHQRDVGRIMGLVKAFALNNLWFRKRDGCVIEANDEDIDAAFTLWGPMQASQDIGLPPYVHDIWSAVILPAYEEKQAKTPSSYGSPVGIGLTRKEILVRYNQMNGRLLSEIMLRQHILPMLEASGLIVQEKDPDDRRQILVYPTIPNTSSGDK